MLCGVAVAEASPGSAGTSAPQGTKPQNPWAPFGYGAFSLLWSATLISNIGTWMHDVGAGWLMTTLNPAPAVVALVQAATTLPLFLFVLMAGALADRLDKRLMLIVVNMILAGVIGALALLVAFDQVTPLGLIVFTFLIGTGAAFIAPAWQSVVPQLVPREDLSAAIALNSMGINLARAIGPAIGGFLIAAVGISVPFFLNALSCLVIVLAVLFWKPAERKPQALPPEPIAGAIATGLRHAAHNGPLKATLLRAVAFFAFASAYWAMLPLVARGIPDGGSALYGGMLTSVGIGAVAGALALPKLKQYFSSNSVALFATLVTGAAMAALAVANTPFIAIPAAFLGGIGWIAMLTSLNVSAQTALPDWVRARGLAVFLMVFSGSMAAGSILWGQVAQYTTLSHALLAASAGIVLALGLVRKVALGQGEAMDLRPAMIWETPVTNHPEEMANDRGPVLITIEYIIDLADEGPFLSALNTLSSERYRDGAFQWGVQQDAADPNRFVEWFLVSSWAEHLRQHDRVTRHDADIQDAVRQFHRGPEAPKVDHLIAPKRGTRA